MRQYIWLTSLSVLTLISACTSTQNGNEAHVDSGGEDSMIKLLTTEDYNDIETRTATADTTYVINFWATWCKPCVEELPYFLDYAQKMRDTKTKMILVSLDFPHQADSKLKPYLEENAIQEEVWHMTNMDYNSWLDDVDPSWSGSIPCTLVKRDGKRLFAEKSYHSVQELAEFVKQIKS